jgi:dihydrofolate reductase
MKLKLIVAMCRGGGIGFHNDIPWKIKKDLLYFSNKTTGYYGKHLRGIQKGTVSTTTILDKSVKKNAIIMGKNTWLSLPKYPEPLKNRDNIILSSSIPESISCRFDSNFDLTVHLSSISRVGEFCMLPDSIFSDENDRYGLLETHEALQMREINRKSILQNNNSAYDEIWIIGGMQVYTIFIEENMKNPMNTTTKTTMNIVIDEFCITYIDRQYECDTFFPSIENMNLYYISSFTKCENIDENISIRVPVYYIIFTLIDYDSSKHIQKKYVESDDKCRYYYYYYATDGDSCDYITNDNIASFMWCITKC